MAVIRQNGKCQSTLKIARHRVNPEISLFRLPEMSNGLLALRLSS
jgi:hypothetical protein